jgi:hypothetical protein
MKSIVTLILAASFVVPAYSQTKLDSGVILPKKREDKKAEAKPEAKPAKKAEKPANKKAVSK